jgi:hypothetical protein
MFSFAKVEKVVNPPQNPTVRKIRHSSERIFVLSDMPKINPIIKQPNKFTAMVPNGNDDTKLFCTALAVRYLAIPPRKLPEPMINNVLSICEDRQKVMSYELNSA